MLLPLAATLTPPSRPPRRWAAAAIARSDGAMIGEASVGLILVTCSRSVNITPINCQHHPHKLGHGIAANGLLVEGVTGMARVIGEPDPL